MTTTRPPQVTLSAENLARLRTYPRPPQDNGIGLHFHVDLSPELIQRTVANLKSIRATWTMIYAQDEQLAESAATACFRAGIMPVVRIGKLIDEGFDPVPYVHALRRALAHFGLTAAYEDAATTPPQINRMTKIITKDKAGTFTRAWQHLDPVAKGDAVIQYDDGSVLAAPEDGVVIMPAPKAESGTEWIYFGRADS